MSDRKPPRDIGGDRTTLTSLLRYQRESVVAKLDGLSDDDARRSPVPTGTSLLWLVKHLTRAEALWVLHRFVGQPLDIADDSLAADDSVAVLVAGYRAMWVRVDGVVAAAAMDDRCAASDTADRPKDRSVSPHASSTT